ncbi:uroporphyrinogen decarboxylase [Tepidanaerobacter syntrophicus]|uniref:uroporphyrinogen decarboxylase family protein n=1 Tax=Tepidanaerobacter syntrophicus TaxID=224999 RepID=UPI0022EF4C76|nr:uroporphyrinogen decarboxylase family protein [Tepidanaerobacter syntrophicus]GLI20117.1 uroporphyrinogen decarboxylase [Tepidanaerobacter syntrophicus]
MINAKKLQEERVKIYEDILDNKIPKRVPVDISLTLEAVAQFGGLDLVEAQWKLEKLKEPADKICQLVYSDICVFAGSFRLPSFYQALESRSFIMASNGFIQHPEVVGMTVEDYDYLIEKPYDCILERVLPRLYKAFNASDPINSAISLTKSLLAYQSDYRQLTDIINDLVEKYGFYPSSIFKGGFTETPFDLLADQLRGFRGISVDIRRIPDKVKAACEALYPIAFKKGLPKNPSKYSRVFMPLHMPAFIREEDFAKLYWPTFKRMTYEYASLGINCSLLCEGDLLRYLDYLYELPTNTLLVFESGDPKLIKEKLGKKHIITGLYPIMSLKTKSKKDCVKEVKEYIDILAPQGKYIFSLDKHPLMLNDINLENLCAVAETVRDYAVYTNPGDTAGIEFNKNDYKAEPSRKLESKYLRTWDKYKESNPNISEFGKDKLQWLEETVFQYLIYLIL